MPMDLSKAAYYEAVQVGAQLVVIAHRDISEPGNILVIQERPSSSYLPEFAIMQDRISVLPHSVSPGLSAFRGMITTANPQYVHIFEKGRAEPKEILVDHRVAENTGTTFELPVIDASSSLQDAVAAMRGQDKRAVIVRAPNHQFRLVTNYEVARAFEKKLSLGDIFAQGHSVTSWKEAVPFTRDRLFSIVRPHLQPIIPVTSLFETIANIVIQGPRLCQCTSHKQGHTVMDQNPTLHGASCIRPLAGHGTYDCY
jgi:hypothetical protein